MTRRDELLGFFLVTLFVAVYGQRPVEQDRWGVYISVSSVVERRQLRLLELNWYNVPHDIWREAYIFLIDRDPRETPWTVLESHQVTGPSGTQKTSVVFPRFNWANLTTDACLGFWVVLSNRPNQVPLASSCIRARPHWMQQHCQKLGHLSFSQLFIPGTHNSAMYDVSSPESVSLVDHFLFNQEEPIINQLYYGIRSLDLRVQEKRGEFWITHDLVRGQVTVREVLQQVRQFVEATGEPVLLDFHRFTTGFSSKNNNSVENHQKLVTLITQELGDFLLERDGTAVKLADILGQCQPVNRGARRRRTVIVCYNAPYFGQGSYYLSPGVRQLWANAVNLTSLRSYLENRVCEPSFGIATSSMVQMTARFPRNLVSNRKLAQQVNFPATGWFRDTWWQCANLVAMDFFLGSNIINVAIDANLRRTM
ncbi:uncharacterized protein LOC8050490 [Ixodes scapularis]|uniref:uncharacterized protein LOC8050490 n=1 Tax=Ixodes scapularis TaxID=6945 RepID=UPI001A9E355C|nr:uncharacterized protein LOC8050490 [Ixodes scapularis]